MDYERSQPEQQADAGATPTVTAPTESASPPEAAVASDGGQGAPVDLDKAAQHFSYLTEGTSSSEGGASAVASPSGEGAVGAPPGSAVAAPPPSATPTDEQVERAQSYCKGLGYGSFLDDWLHLDPNKGLAGTWTEWIYGSNGKGGLVNPKPGDSTGTQIAKGFGMWGLSPLWLAGDIVAEGIDLLHHGEMHKIAPIPPRAAYIDEEGEKYNKCVEHKIHDQVHPPEFHEEPEEIPPMVELPYMTATAEPEHEAPPAPKK